MADRSLAPSPFDKISLQSLLSQTGLALIALGFASGIPIQTMGRIYVGEAVLAACAPVIALLLFGLSNEYGRMARLLLGMMVVSWIGYLLSDIVRGTPSHDYVRGWSRWIAMGASFASLAWIGSKSISYVGSFLIGLSIGTCAAPFISGGFFGGPSIANYWKFHASVPVCILVLLATSFMRPLATIAACFGLAAVSILFDSRAVALMCIGTAAITWLASRRSTRIRDLAVPLSKTSVVVGSLVLALTAAGSVYSIQHFGDRLGLTRRFDNSNQTRLASATVTWSAIRESPLVGYGSWPRDARFAAERDRLVSAARGGRTLRSENQEDLIIAHSQILQGWLEGGILGLAFFVVMGWQLGKQLLWQSFRGPILALTPAIVFVQIHSVWHLVFSPFSGAQRVFIPTACVFICLIAQQMSQLESLRRGAALGYWQRPRLAT